MRTLGLCEVHLSQFGNGIKKFSFLLGLQAARCKEHRAPLLELLRTGCK